MYYIFYEKLENRLNGAGECRILNEEVENIEVTEDLYNSYIDNPDYYIYKDGQVVVNPNYEEEQAKKRKTNFESNFLTTSKGNYRLSPKGYANAQQSIDTVNNMVNTLGSLTEDIASMVIFYSTPDFTKEEECTEEWLVEHQTTLKAMTKEEWATFYIEFTTLYAQKQYKIAMGEV